MIPSKQAKMQIQDFNNIISSIYNKITINKAQPKSYSYINMLKFNNIYILFIKPIP